ncbi:hypothetical protein PGB90_008277 [Kerria lacca]
MSVLRKKPVTTDNSNKQIFGGKLPSFIERIIQRIQNYFSVYNPPEYFEGNRPPATPSENIAIICANMENDSLSCNPISENDYGSTDANCENSISESGSTENNDEAGYNVVVTHTVVHDNMINVYSPADSSSQVVSNVVVILEPSEEEYSPPPQPTPNKNKFYVYVNPTKANKKKNQFQTKLEMEEKEKPESFQPYTNATYTVIIRSDKLQEFSNNIDNADNNSLNPEIGIYDGQNEMNPCKSTNPSEKYNCKKEISVVVPNEENVLASRSIVEGKNLDLPNINLVLVPPNDNNANTSCSKNKFEEKDVEYYILKPDNGNITKPKDVMKNQTRINVTSVTYLPPKKSESEFNDSNNKQNTSATVYAVITEPTTNRFPLLFNLFHKRPEEPREP